LTEEDDDKDWVTRLANVIQIYEKIIAVKNEGDIIITANDLPELLDPEFKGQADGEDLRSGDRMGAKSLRAMRERRY